MKTKFSVPARARVAAQFGGWDLYELAPTGTLSFLWLGFKLMAPAGTPKRRGSLRAFWMTWSPIELRFARRREYLRLAAEQPALCAEVERFLSAAYDRAWLLREGGVTESEIEAEIARLALARQRWRGL